MTTPRTFRLRQRADALARHARTYQQETMEVDDVIVRRELVEASEALMRAVQRLNTLAERERDAS